MSKRIYKTLQRLKIDGKSVPKGTLLDSSQLEALANEEIDSLCKRNPPALVLISEIKTDETTSLTEENPEEEPKKANESLNFENDDANFGNDEVNSEQSFTDFENPDFEPLNIEEFEEIPVAESEETEAKKPKSKSSKK